MLARRGFREVRKGVHGAQEGGSCAPEVRVRVRRQVEEVEGCPGVNQEAS